MQNTMKKSERTFKPIVKYLRELSIVVTGVAITVCLGFLVNSVNNRKDMKQYLLSVRLELEENAENFDFHGKMLQKPVRYANYLNVTDEKSINLDSLHYYMNNDESGYGFGYYLLPTATFMTNAFEMLKSSGAMRQIKDKELLLSLWKAYTKIEDTKLNLDKAFQTKGEEVMKWLQLMAVENRMGIPMQIFYCADLPLAMVQWCEQTSETIKETLSKLEEAKIVKK